VSAPGDGLRVAGDDPSPPAAPSLPLPPAAPSSPPHAATENAATTTSAARSATSSVAAPGVRLPATRALPAAAVAPRAPLM